MRARVRGPGHAPAGVLANLSKAWRYRITKLFAETNPLVVHPLGCTADHRLAFSTADKIPAPKSRNRRHQLHVVADRFLVDAAQH